MRGDGANRLLLLLVLASTAGCDVYHPEVLDGAMDAGSDAGSDAGVSDAGPEDASLDAGPEDAGSDAGASCVPRHAPPPPTVADGDGPDVVFALRDVVLDQTAGVWGEIGLDLDDACTSDRATATCDPRSSGSVRIDGAEGVDNAVGAELFGALLEANPGAEAEAHDNQTAGDGTVVLHLAGWSGERNDPVVAAYVAQSVYAVPEGGVRGDPLAWDGTDSFFVSDADFLDGDVGQPLIVDDAAYVADGQLVMNVPDGRSIFFPWSGNLLELRTTDGVLTGTIDAAGTGIEDVTITGRWALLDVGMALTRMGVCPGTGERVAANRLVEMIADVRSDEDTDGLGARCDAISIAVQLDGHVARLGGVVPVETEPTPCP